MAEITEAETEKIDQRILREILRTVKDIVRRKDSMDQDMLLLARLSASAAVSAISDPRLRERAFYSIRQLGGEKGE